MTSPLSADQQVAPSELPSNAPSPPTLATLHHQAPSSPSNRRSCTCQYTLATSLISPVPETTFSTPVRPSSANESFHLVSLTSHSAMVDAAPRSLRLGLLSEGPWGSTVARPTQELSTSDPP